MIPLAPEGYPFILAPAVLGVLAWAFGAWPLAVVLWLLALGCIAFFRDPSRTSEAATDRVLSPADGKVLSVGPSPPRLAGLDLPVQVSIFMSPANVHVNRAPIGGLVKEATYSRGRHFPAFRDKASDDNEHSFVILCGPQGSVAYKQIAGTLARRVVCDLQAGEEVTRGQRVGIIKFSSRVDLFLPAGARVLVTPDQRTLAGVTEVAVMPPSSGPA